MKSLEEFYVTEKKSIIQNFTEFILTHEDKDDNFTNLIFRMVGSGFLKVLASYFGFPIFLTIAFVILIFWFCRFFKANEVLRLQDPPRNNEVVRPEVPQRGINLGQMLATVLFFLIFSTVNAITPDECGNSIKRYFSKIKKTFEICDAPTDEFYLVRDSLCSVFPVQDKLCYSLEDMIPIIWAVIILLLVATLAYILIRQKQRCL